MLKETTRGAATGIGFGFGCCAAPFLIGAVAVLGFLVFIGYVIVAGSEKMLPPLNSPPGTSAR